MYNFFTLRISVTYTYEFACLGHGISDPWKSAKLIMTLHLGCSNNNDTFDSSLRIGVKLKYWIKALCNVSMSI